MKIDKVFATDGISSLLKIKFNTIANIKIGNVVFTEFENAKRYFKVYKIETINQFQLECEAIAYGYGREKLEDDDIDDIRDLLDYELKIEENQETLSILQSHDEWC